MIIVNVYDTCLKEGDANTLGHLLQLTPFFLYFWQHLDLGTIQGVSQQFLVPTDNSFTLVFS